MHFIKNYEYDVDYNPYRRKGEILTNEYDYLGIDDDIYEEKLISNQEQTIHKLYF